MFVYRKKKSDDNQQGAVTHTSLRPTSSPSWEEMISTSMDSTKAGDDCKYPKDIKCQGMGWMISNSRAGDELSYLKDIKH